MKELNVFLSPLAAKKLEITLDQIRENWSERIKDEFLARFKTKVEQISKFPKSSQKSTKQEGLYRAVVDQNTSFFYRIHQDSIEIITVFDNRQNPDSVDQEIK